MNQPTRLAAMALTIALMTACGGSDPDPSAALTTSSPALVLAASGTARLITVINLGPQPTAALHIDAVGLPAGSQMRSTCPATLEVGASCLVLVTPGAVPSATPGDLAPVAANVTAKSANSPAINVSVSVLAHGSVHQGGHVFALDDSAPLTESVKGKVLATVDTAGSKWSAVNIAIPGIGADATAALGGCDGAINGRCNTDRILAQFPQDSRSSAAALCADSRHGGHNDWYLPAVCELTYDDGVTHTLCGTRAAPKLPDNVRSRLLDTGTIGNFDLAYWSSTQSASNPAGDAHVAVYGLGINTSVQNKQTTPIPSKCVRAFAP